jgi:hypothetical protein
VAVYERKFQKATRKQLIKCIRWCQNILNLRDWRIEFYIGPTNKDQDEYANTEITPGNMWRFIAEIWLDLVLCEKMDVNPYRAVCHELVHVLVLGKCRINCVGEEDEHISWAFEDLLYEKFCKDNKIKKMPFREI